MDRSLPGNDFTVFADKKDSNMCRFASTILLFVLHSRRVHPKYTCSRRGEGSSKSTFSSTFPQKLQVFRLSMFMSSKYTKRNELSSQTSKNIPISSEDFPECRSHTNPANGCPYKMSFRWYHKVVSLIQHILDIENVEDVSNTWTFRFGQSQ